MIVQNGEAGPTDQGILDLIAKYKSWSKPIANKVIGHIDRAPTSSSRTADANGGDSALGNLIADAQKADDSVVTRTARPRSSRS